MTMCFNCVYRNITTVNEDLECRCRKDGKSKNPYRPMVLFDRECPNYREENHDAETVRN